MRKEFDSVHFLNVKSEIDEETGDTYLYIPGLNFTITKYKFVLLNNNTNNNNTNINNEMENYLEKINEFVFSDEILDFHILKKGEVVIVGKSNKIIALYNFKGEKLDE